MDVPPPSALRRWKPLSWHCKRFNISFRFGVLQSVKLRAFGDLKHAMTNSARSVETPNQLVSWDHLVQMSQLLPQGGATGPCLKPIAKRIISSSQSP